MKVLKCGLKVLILLVSSAKSDFRRHLYQPQSFTIETKDAGVLVLIGVPCQTWASLVHNFPQDELVGLRPKLC